MNDMAASIFDNKTLQPEARQLANALGKSVKLWEKIQSRLAADYEPLTYEWKFYGPKTGWLMKVLQRKRNLFFLTPLAGSFRLAFVFGEKAVAAISHSDLPEPLKAAIKAAPKYVEGRGLQIEVKSDADVSHVLKLIACKAAN